MIAAFYGKDSFRAREALAEFVREIDTDGMISDNTTRVEGASTRPNELLALCQTIPFLSSKRLVIVEGLLARFESAGRGRRGAPRKGRAADLGDWQLFVDGMAELPDTTVLVFLDAGIAAKNPLLAALPKGMKAQEFKPMPQGELAAWIVQRAPRYGLVLQPRATAALAGLVGNDLQVLDSELQKLAAYANGQPVTEEDVRALVSLARAPSVFAMADAVIEGRAQDAATLVQRLLADGEAPQLLLSMIARQYRMLLLTKELLDRRVRPAEIGTRLGVQSFVMQRLLQQAPGHTLERLQHAYRRLLEADLSIKRGVFDDETALQLLVVELATAARPSPGAGRGYSRPPAGPGPARPAPARG
ncbi:MAG: DNA polymerase III subunit delta [Dehalococcoidia bacterium]